VNVSVRIRGSPRMCYIIFSFRGSIKLEFNVDGFISRMFGIGMSFNRLNSLSTIFGASGPISAFCLIEMFCNNSIVSLQNSLDRPQVLIIRLPVIMRTSCYCFHSLAHRGRQNIIMASFYFNSVLVRQRKPIDHIIIF